MNWSTARGALWPHVQRALRVSEATVPENMTEWHDYVIEWGYDRARFQVDHTAVLDCDTPPRGALGLVVWLDNQFLVVNPRGRLRSGLLATSGAQWLEIGSMEIRSQESEFRSQRPF